MTRCVSFNSNSSSYIIHNALSMQWTPRTDGRNIHIVISHHTSHHPQCFVYAVDPKNTWEEYTYSDITSHKTDTPFTNTVSSELFHHLSTTLVDTLPLAAHL